MEFGEEDRDRKLFSSSCLWLLMLTLITWLLWSWSGFSSVEISLTFVAYTLWKETSLCIPPYAEPTVALPPFRMEYLLKEIVISWNSSAWDICFFPPINSVIFVVSVLSHEFLSLYLGLLAKTILLLKLFYFWPLGYWELFEFPLIPLWHTSINVAVLFFGFWGSASLLSGTIWWFRLVLWISFLPITKHRISHFLWKQVFLCCFHFVLFLNNKSEERTT